MHVILTLAFLSSDAPGQSDRVLLTSGLSETQSHAWSVYHNSQDEILLVHFPPRDVISDQQPVAIAAKPGQVKAMRSLGERMPRAIAAIEDQVFLLYHPVYANEQRMMRLYSTRVVTSPVGGGWVLDPIERLNSEPPIISDGELLDLIATQDTLWALLVEGGQRRLRFLTDEGWVDHPLPESLNDSSALMLSAIGADLLVIERFEGVMKFSRLGSDLDGWSPMRAIESVAAGAESIVLPGLRGMHLLDWPADNKARLRLWADGDLFQLGADLPIQTGARVSLLTSANELIAVSHSSEQVEDDGVSDTEFVAGVTLTEIDLGDSSVLYQGAPVPQTAVSADELKFLFLMMILIMIGVLVVVIMPDRPDAMIVPRGCSLADPGRRLIATMLDVLLVAVLMGRVFHVSASEILTLSVIVRPDNAAGVIPLTMLAGVVLMTFFEWLMGATPGKLFVGIRVVRSQEGAPRRPRLWSALVRNTIKWILPPVAALALVDPEGLHRGDRASRSLVIIPLATPGYDELGGRDEQSEYEESGPDKPET